MVLALRPSCAARVAVDLGVEGRRVDLLLQMRIGDAGNRGNALAQLLCHTQVVPVVADGAHVDLRRQPEIQNLRHDVGGLEIEHVLRKRRRQHLAQFA